MLVYAGSFDSMDGPVTVTEEQIDLLIQNHNASLSRLEAAGDGDEAHFVRSCPPLQVDHSTSAMMTVGRVVGRLSKGTHTLEDGSQAPCLLTDRVRVLGAENIEKCKDGRWATISIGADLEKGVLNELSITPFPAAPNASLLAKRLARFSAPYEVSSTKYRGVQIEIYQMNEDDEPEEYGWQIDEWDEYGTEKTEAKALAVAKKLIDDVQKKDTKKRLASIKWGECTIETKKVKAPADSGQDFWFEVVVKYNGSVIREIGNYEVEADGIRDAKEYIKVAIAADRRMAMQSVVVRGEGFKIVHEIPKGYFVIWDEKGPGKKEGPFDTLDQAKEHVGLSGGRLAKGQGDGSHSDWMCPECYKEFNSSMELAQHQRETGHTNKIKTSKGDPMHEKLKKHLMEAKKMSSEDADKHLAALKEHLKKHLGHDDEGADKHLASMEPEHADKMSAAMAALAADEGEKEQGKKLKAATPKLVQLSKTFSKEVKQAQLAAKVSGISARLSRLQAEAKITPAERKKIDVAKLAALSPDAIAERLTAYEDREPVIDARVHGTTRAVNLAKLKAEAEKVQLEAETKKDFGVKLSEHEEKVLAGGGAAAPGAGAQPAVTADHDGDEHMNKLAAMLGDHPAKDAVLKHVAAMMAPAHLEAPGHNVGDEKQLSALAENVNRLQTQFDGIVGLISDATGLKPADLTE